MRILFISGYYKPAFIYGGPVNSVSNLSEGLAELGADVSVYTTDANGYKRLNISTKKPTNLNGVTVCYYPLTVKPFAFSPALLLSLDLQKAILNLGNFDIVLTSELWGNLTVPIAIVCKRNKIPLVVSLRGQLSTWAIHYKRIKKYIYLYLWGIHYLNMASAIHCTDETEADSFPKFGIKSPYFVVPNGINLRKFTTESSKGLIRSKLNIPPEDYILLFLGRLHHQKRPDIAVTTLSAIKKSRVHLVFAGPDEENLTDSLIRQAQSLGCIDRIHFTGLLNDEEVIHMLKDSDLLIMPSEKSSESFGMAAVEAMAASIPILVSEGVPIGKLAVQYGAGMSIPCTSEAFVEAANKLFATPEKLMEMGERGVKLVREVYDRSSVSSKMLSQFHSIIHTGRPHNIWQS